MNRNIYKNQNINPTIVVVLKVMSEHIFLHTASIDIVDY